MSFLSARRWALTETFRGIYETKGLFALGTLLSALALSVPLFISTLFYELAEPLRQLPTSVEISVFTKDKTDTTALSKAVQAIALVDGVRLIGREEAMKSLNDQLGIKNRTIEHNPLPDILIVTLVPSASEQEADTAAAAIEKMPGVDMIAYEASWRDKLQAVSYAGQTTVICLGVVVLALVILVLAASIRMMTLTAMPQMRALYLFGASPSFAMRPWAWRGFILMALASLGAIGITETGLLALNQPMQTLNRLYGINLQLSLPETSWCIGFVTICSLVGYIVSVLAAQDSWRRAQH